MKARTLHFALCLIVIAPLAVANDKGISKCPAVCRTGPNAKKYVKKECQRGKVTCSQKYKSCVIADCIKIVNRKQTHGYKCVCPPCPDRCYGGLRGQSKALKECGDAQCHRLTIPNDKCVLQTCNTAKHKPGFKCGCAGSEDSCPNKCVPGRVGFFSAKVECSKQNGPVCTGSGEACQVTKCVEHGVKGTKCGCPADKRKCPETCHLDLHGPTIAKEECLVDWECDKGACEVRDCFDGAQKGTKCGCEDEVPPPSCPNKCRFSKRGKRKSIAECTQLLYCPDGKCEVRSCFSYDNLKEGLQCGCTDPTPPLKECPNQCYIGDDSNTKAKFDCAEDRRCDSLDETCEVRPCYRGEDSGHKCGCKKEPEPPQPCPDECYYGSSARALAKKACDSAEHYCHKGDCQVRTCYNEDTHERGSKCGCRDEPPPPRPCPEICHVNRELAVSIDEAEWDCRGDFHCSKDRDCKIRTCYVDGEQGRKCGCGEEVLPPAPCPEECHVALGEGKAHEQCHDTITDELYTHLTCKDGDCKVHPCFDEHGMEGSKCGCAVGLPPVANPCPSVCRKGRSGRREAKRECDKYPLCPTSRQRCEVQNCNVRGKKGSRCGCAPVPV